MKTVLTLYHSKLDSSTHYDEGGVRRTEMSHYIIPYIYCGKFFRRLTTKGFSLNPKQIEGGRHIGVILCSKEGSEVMGTTKRNMWVCLKLSKRGWK